MAKKRSWRDAYKEIQNGSSESETEKTGQGNKRSWRDAYAERQSGSSGLTWRDEIDARKRATEAFSNAVHVTRTRNRASQNESATVAIGGAYSRLLREEQEAIRNAETIAQKRTNTITKAGGDISIGNLRSRIDQLERDILDPASGQNASLPRHVLQEESSYLKGVRQQILDAAKAEWDEAEAEKAKEQDSSLYAANSQKALSAKANWQYLYANLVGGDLEQAEREYNEAAMNASSYVGGDAATQRNLETIANEKRFTYETLRDYQGAARVESLKAEMDEASIAYNEAMFAATEAEMRGESIESYEREINKAKKRFDASRKHYEQVYNEVYGDGTLANALDLAGTAALRGVATLLKQATSTINFLNGMNPLMSEQNKAFSGELNNAATDWLNHLDERATVTARKLGDSSLWEYGADAVTVLVDTAPMIAIAAATGGASTGGSVIAEGGSKFANLMNTIGNVVKGWAQAPSFWAGVAMETGMNYEQAKGAGASEFQATAYAMVTSLVNAAVEVGINSDSGIQGVPKTLLEAADSGNDAFVRAIIKSAISEGNEEMLQDIVSGVNAFLVYGHDTGMEFFSTTNEEAAINPRRIAESGLMGAVVAVPGGAITGAASSIRNRGIAQDIKAAGATQQLVDRGLAKPVDSRAYRLAYQAKGNQQLNEEISDTLIGELYSELEPDLRAEYDEAVAEREKQQEQQTGLPGVSRGSYEDVMAAQESRKEIENDLSSIGIPKDVAKQFAQAYGDDSRVNPVGYALAMDEAYRHGLRNLPLAELTTSKYARLLTSEQQSLAYTLGQEAGDDASVSATVRKASTAKIAEGYTNVAFEGEVNISGAANEKQRAEIAFMDFVAREFSGNNVRVYSSYEKNGQRMYTDSNGVERIAPNGMYEAGSGDVWIDLNAGDEGQGAVLHAFAHEMSHFIQEWNAEGMRSLAAFMVGEFSQASNVSGAIARQQEKAIRAGHGVEWLMSEYGMTEAEAQEALEQRAYEDFVADALDRMFTEGNFVETVQRMNQQDKALVDKIREFIDRWVDKLRSFYKSLKGGSYEGSIVASLNRFEEIQRQYADALKGAGERYRTADNTHGRIQVRFSERETLAQAADAMESIGDEEYLLAKEEHPFVLVMDHTPLVVLDSMGKGSTARDRRVIIRRDALYLAIRNGGVQEGNYHGLGAETLKRLPEYLENPDVVLKTDGSSKKRIILASIPAKNGQGLISIEFESPKEYWGKNEFFNIVITAFDLRKNYLKNLFSKHDAEVKYEKEGLAQVNPQLHEWLRTFNEKPSNENVPQSQDAVKHFSDRDSAYLSAVEGGDMETAQKMVDEAASKAGFKIRAYHGTGRSDRVGTVFRPERVTSGPMAFFTSDPEIASNYARDKADTSLAYDDEYSDYYSQFRATKNGKSIKVQDLWRTLRYSEKKRIAEAGKHITWDDEMENIVWDDDATRGLDNWDSYLLNEHKGNALEALIDSWLESGELYNQESRFLQVLELAGVNDIEYRDPDARYEKVYDTYLGIRNPFGTESADESFIAGYESWYKNQPLGKYDRVSAGADMWDKNSRTAEMFAENLRDDLANETSYSWTSIPDSMTDYLKNLGYDGIKDQGGKRGGQSHTVWIPFYSEQVKSAEPVVYDDSGRVIPLSERFNSEKTDIRFSDRDSSYMSAVNKGDMEVVKRIVDEAARKAGFPEKLFHGTTAFGFTQIKTEGLEEGVEWSPFFATDSLETAGTYSSESTVREIGNTKKSAPESELVKNYNDLVYDFVTEVNRLAGSYNFLGYDDRTFQELLEEAQEGVDFGELLERFMVRYDEIVESLAEAGAEATEKLANLAYNAGTTLASISMVADGDPGNYQLYANADDFFEIDAKGHKWDEIEFAQYDDGLNPIVNTRMIASYARSRGYKGVKIANVYDDGARGTKRQQKPATVYIFFEPQWQVKSADPVTYDDAGNVIPLSKRFDTSNPDIRFSERTPSYQDLVRENRELTEDLQRARDLVRLHRSGTENGLIFTEKSVDRVSKDIMEYAGAVGSRREFKKLLSTLYRYIAAGEELTWEGVQENAKPAIDWLISKQPRVSDEYAKDVLASIRMTKFSLDDTQKAEVASAYGSYAEYRKQNFGSFVVSDNAQPLEAAWMELSTLYPNVFPVDAAPGDMPLLMASVVSDMKQRRDHTMATYSGEEERNDLLYRIYDNYWNVDPVRSAAVKARDELALVRSKHREAMQRAREIRETRLSALRDSFKTREEKRKRTMLRNKVQRTAKKLSDLLTKKSKEKHVPYYLEQPVAELLDSFDVFGLEARRNQLEEARKTYEEATDPITADRMERRIPNLEDIVTHLESLRSAYKKMEGSTDADVSDAYDQSVEDAIIGLKDTLNQINQIEVSASQGTRDLAKGLRTIGKERTIADLDSEQLEAIYKVFASILGKVRTANKTFADDRKETVSNLREEVVGEITSIHGERDDFIEVPGKEAALKGQWMNLIPVYAMRRIGSDTLSRLWDNLSHGGQAVYGTDIAEAKDFFRQVADETGYRKWDLSKTYGESFESADGKTFYLTLGEMMSIYAYSKRESAKQHLLIGGFTHDSKIRLKYGGRTHKPNSATKYKMNEGTIQSVASKLTEEQRQFVDRMQGYLSTTMGAKGNEVSRKLYQVELFGEEYYFPMKVSSSGRPVSYEGDESIVQLKNMGFTRALTPNASNALVVGDFLSVWDRHINQMSAYHAYVLPMEDFYRVVGGVNFLENGERLSVNDALDNAFEGKVASNYLNTLIEDINGKSGTDSRGSEYAWLLRTYKRASVALSASVTVQQPSSIDRAKAYLDDKYFLGAPRISIGKAWEELKKYAPIAVIKELGRFDANMGQTLGEYVHGGTSIDDVLGFAPGYMDRRTWVNIWYAVKREAEATQKDLTPGSEEFLEYCGKRFTEIIELTQVVDSVFTRSQLMRSKNPNAQALTSFMAEPTLTQNMVMDAHLMAVRGNKKQAARTYASALRSMVLNAFLVSFVYAARDDDEDQSYVEKYVEAFLNNFSRSMMPWNYFPLLRDLGTIFVDGYDIERADMALLADLANDLEKIANAHEDVNNGKDRRTLVEAYVQLAVDLSAFTKVPLRNVVKDIRGIHQIVTRYIPDAAKAFKDRLYDTTLTGLRKAVRDSFGNRWFDGVSKLDQLYEANVRGDDRHVDRLRATYEDDEAFNTALRQALQAHDPRITEAAQAHIDGDLTTYNRIIDEIIGEGHFDRNRIIGAISSVESKLTPDEEKPYTDKQKAKYDAKDLIDAYLTEPELIDTIREDILDTYEANGKTEEEARKNLASSLTSAAKEAHKQGTLTDEEAMDLLIDQNGYTEDDAYWKLREWETGESSDYNTLRLNLWSGDGISSAVRELTSHGYTKEKVEAEVRSSLQKMYWGEWEGNKNSLSKTLVINRLATYGGKTKEEAEELVRQWTCYKVTGIKYGDIKQAYLDRKITASRAAKMLQDYGGLTAAEAQKRVEGYTK